VNLLSNAFKFTRDGSPRSSRWGGREEGEKEGEVIYFVRDNGAGFGYEYAGSSSVCFQRLHGRRSLEGTGLVCRIVQRVVRARGRILGGRQVLLTTRCTIDKPIPVPRILRPVQPLKHTEDFPAYFISKPAPLSRTK